MRQHHALGRAAGAGGVDQAGQRVGRDRRRLQRDVVGRRRIGDQSRPVHQPWRAAGVIRRSIDHHQQIEAAGLSAGLAQRAGECRGGHDGRARAGIAQDVGVIGDGVGGVGRHRHRADRHQRGLGDRVFRPVLRHDHHPVAGGHAGGAQMPRAGRGHAAELAPGDGVPGAVAECAQQGLVRPGAGQREHHRRQIGPGRIAAPRTSRRRLRRRNPLTAAPTTLHG